MLRRLVSAALVAAATMAFPAAAAWHKAESRHFVIYSEMRPSDLKEYAQKLERFDKAVRLALRAEDPDVGDGNRVHIYQLRDVAAVQRLYSTASSSVYGFYSPRYSGPVAFVPQFADSGPSGLSSERVFFHEYAHHLMFQDMKTPYPNWYVEGFAEMIGSPRFDKDGSITVGLAPQHRGGSLFFGFGGLSTVDMLTNQPAKLDGRQRESLYGRGWLLTHYLTFDPSRSGQLAKYFTLLNRGTSAADSAKTAFGDLAVLDKELDRYLAKSKLLSLRIDGRVLDAGPVTVTPLSEAAGRALPSIMRSRRGVNAKFAAEVVEKMREIGASAPQDGEVQLGLAEAELDAKNPDKALVAADAAIAARPKYAQGHVYRGLALMALAKEKKDAALYAQARKSFIAANTLDKEDPEPLYEYYQSFATEGKAPAKDAIEALHYASVLAPFDPMVRISSARALIDAGRLELARAALMPVAYNPHGGAMADAAKSAMTLLAAKDGKAAREALNPPRPPVGAATGG